MTNDARLHHCRNSGDTKTSTFEDTRDRDDDGKLSSPQKLPGHIDPDQHGDRLRRAGILSGDSHAWPGDRTAPRAAPRATDLIPLLRAPMNSSPDPDRSWRRSIATRFTRPRQ